MLRRRRKLEPLPPPAYITLAEVKERGLERVPFDILAPADKQRAAQHFMRGIDDLPPEVRVVIKNAVHGDRLRAYITFAVTNLDIGHSTERVVEVIKLMDSWSPAS